MKFTTEQLAHIKAAITKSFWTSTDMPNIDKVMETLSPHVYEPANGEVYAYRYAPGGWYYNIWPNGSKVPVTMNIERRALVISEIPS